MFSPKQWKSLPPGQCKSNTIYKVSGKSKTQFILKIKSLIVSVRNCNWYQKKAYFMRFFSRTCKLVLATLLSNLFLIKWPGMCHIAHTLRVRMHIELLWANVFGYYQNNIFYIYFNSLIYLCKGFRSYFLKDLSKNTSVFDTIHKF